jgi:signal transduction histidine kinase
MRAALNVFDRATLTQQVLGLGLAASSTCALALWWWQPPPTALWAVWVLGTGALATLACSWPAWREVRSVHDVSAAARVLSRDDAPEDSNLPYKSPTRELHDATLALRRMVDAARQRQQALVARNKALGVQLQSRTQQLSSLQDLSIGLATHNDMAGLVAEALSALQQTVSYASASVWARAGLERAQPVELLGYRSGEAELSGLALSDLQGLRLSRANQQRYEQIEQDGQAIVENRPRQSLLSWLWAMVTDDARTSALYRSTRAWMAVPLKVREQVLGVLRVDHSEPGYFDPERERLLLAVGSQTALAMRHAALLAQERDVAVMAERNRIARELHDACSQTLFAANLAAGTLSRALGTQDPARQQVQILERLNRSALAEMRMLMFELRPDAFEGTRLCDLLQQAVEALAGRGEIEVGTDLCNADVLPTARRVQVYRIAQEALSNIARHSAARNAQVSWRLREPGRAVLRVADDGRGFDPGLPHPGHFGLGNMQERAAEIGATLNVRSAPGQGTELLLELSAGSD